MPLEIQLKAYADVVNARLDQLLPPTQATPTELHAAMSYTCLPPGKRLRPALCMACAEAVGAQAESVIDAACAIEMVHCFSLIHDDLPAIDDDDLRRGLPSCHKQFGEAIALLAGDALFSLAFEVLSHCGTPGTRASSSPSHQNGPASAEPGTRASSSPRDQNGRAPSEHRTPNTQHPTPNASTPQQVLRAVQVLTKATGSDGLVGGEVADVLSEGVEIDGNQLRSIHARKTGALMGAACEIGAILGGGSQEDIARLKGFGEKVGLAFQIVDDILNETADPAKLGKAVGSDRERSKATYTALYGLEEANRMARETVAAAKAAVTPTGFLADLAEFTVRRLH